ncbi:hypothetical protein EXIGUO8H_20372 [Exiguobacterium sp. 8H]|uniref:hypothetical protein n=1 Tax=unclassified Exiguobacterium TaxID=2644629 RepID=UPI0012F0083E|nr:MULTISPECIES: hypothetical protein [unclassified Exiguobacterium]VXB53010.1 hypothetical protein EXIGUO8A_11441 [Exiguobacterium sp. 8A]VXB53633.1 hypothetical protein EXIGUO8H_20372 [Exiguobacterium sp. 8H]
MGYKDVVLLVFVLTVLILLALAMFEQEIKMAMRKRRIPTQTYRVFVTGNYKGSFIGEGDAKVPINFQFEDGIRVESLAKANPSHDIYMKAKIDPKTWEVLSVEGYTLKPQEEAE